MKKFTNGIGGDGICRRIIHTDMSCHQPKVISLPGFRCTISRERNAIKTFHTYLNDIRMVHALTDMENYGVTETEAALNNGFANVKSFIQTFKRNYKCTLSQYVRDNNSLPVIHGFNKLVDENIFSKQK